VSDATNAESALLLDNPRPTSQGSSQGIEVGAMNDERIARLERLAKLREEGALSQEEFDVEKARVLNSSDLPTPPDTKANPISAPVNALTSLSNGWLISGLGALVFAAVALVAVMMGNRDADDGVAVAKERSQAPVVTAAPVVQEPEVAAASPAQPEPMRSETVVGTVPPKITGEWRSLRTRIREGWGTEPTFADRYVIIRIGCGTGCTGNIVGDHRTGDLYPLGLGGEGYDQLQLRFDNASNLLTARWGEIETQTCVTQRYRWTGTELEEAAARETTRRVDFGCDELEI
jgi:hypothetical protein